MLHLEPGWNLEKLRLELDYIFNVCVKIMEVPCTTGNQ